MKASKVLMILLLVVHSSGQEQRMAKLPASIEVLWLKAQVSGSVCNFSGEHFRNSEAMLFQRSGKSESARLRNGNFERKQIDPNNQLHQVRYKWSYTVEDKSYALVSYIWEWVGGSSSQDVVVQVWGCENGRPVVKQQITGDGHSMNAGADYHPKGERLVLRSVNYGNGAHCCPELLDRAIFRWTGADLHLMAAETIPMPK